MIDKTDINKKHFFLVLCFLFLLDWVIWVMKARRHTYM